MEFADGGQVNDKNYMQKHGINVNEVPRPGPDVFRHTLLLFLSPSLFLQRVYTHLVTSHL